MKRFYITLAGLFLMVLAWELGAQKTSFYNTKVGINTNNPTYALQIYQPDISMAAIDITYAAGAGNTRGIQLHNGSGLTNFSIGVDGSMFVGGQIRLGAEGGSQPAMLYITNHGTGPSLQIDGIHGIGQLTLLTNGNVGIGTNAPAATLDVLGHAVVSGGASVGVLYYDGILNVPQHGSYPLGGSPKVGNLRLGDTTGVIVSNTGAFASANMTNTYNAFPGLARLPNGHLMAFFSSAAGHATVPGTAWSSISTDHGKTWSTPEMFYDPTNSAFVGHAAPATANGIVMDNGVLLFTTGVLKTNASTVRKSHLAYILGIVNPDDTITKFYTNTIATNSAVFGTPLANVFTENNAVQLRDGSILWPIVTEPTVAAFTGATLKSSDRGRTWANYTLISPAGSSVGTSYSEPEIVQLPSGRLLCVMRALDVSTAPDDYYYVSAYSSDLGATWGAPTRLTVNDGVTTFTNNNGKANLTLLGSGGILMLARHGTNVFQTIYTTSWDEGSTWSAINYLPGVSNRTYVYASSVLLSDGEVGVAVGLDQNDNSNSIVRYFSFYDGYGIRSGGIGELSDFSVASNLLVGPIDSPTLTLISSPTSNTLSTTVPISMLGPGWYDPITITNEATPNFFRYDNGMAIFNGTNAIGSSNSMFVLSNSVVATPQVPSPAPSLAFMSQVYGTQGLASVTMGTRYLNLPIDGTSAAAPTVNHIWQHKISTGNWIEDMNLTSGGILNVVSTVNAGLNVTAVGNVQHANGGRFISGPSRSSIGAHAAGSLTINRASDASLTVGDFFGLMFGGTASTNAQLRITNGPRPRIDFLDGTTNNWIDVGVGNLDAKTNVIALGLRLGNGGVTLTNVLTGSATLDFASQTVGGAEDLPITVAGAAEGDFAIPAPPAVSTTGIIGSYSAWASNGVVFVRFVSTGTAQNPASGTFKVIAYKTQ